MKVPRSAIVTLALMVITTLVGCADELCMNLSDMPVWGYEFFGQQADDERAHAQAAEKVDALVNYLRKRQRPAS